ncbi:hypothetical protein M413DRAFT_438916 [Hebeloma cylindrosporum]|uniref:Uncharacterized protein n=1 Tax=Hebeloma cylindrosporum TaxID=76867 RepID=A0A0C2YJ32_HEBCY|nr:hypothetical protein M413DRAFT_438916 [Hebeloma cylindrosporum h7]
MTGSQVLATPLFFGSRSTVEVRAVDFDDLDIRDFSEALLESRDDVIERNWPDIESDLFERYVVDFGDQVERREDELERRDPFDPHHFRIGVVMQG